MKTIREISDIIEGRILCGIEKIEKPIEHAFASDLMSDVLTVEKDNLLLITGLANLHAVRTSDRLIINAETGIGTPVNLPLKNGYKLVF